MAHSRRPYLSWMTLAGITLLAFVLRMPLLGQKSLWIDEIWSIEISRMSWTSFVWILKNQDPNTSLYYVLLHLWQHIGHSEFVVRLLSVLLATATIPVFYALAKRVVGDGALIASGLMAINLFHIQWSQEARGYSLVVLMVTCSSYCFVRAVEHSSVPNWSAYIIVSTLAVYSHLFGALVVMAHFVSLTLVRERHVWKAFVAACASIGVLVLPLAMLILRRVGDPFVPLGWLPRPTPHRIYDAFYSLAGNAEYPGSRGGKPILVACFVVCLLAVAQGIKRWRANGRSSETWHMGLVLSWLLLPILIVALVSLVQPMFMARYLLICVPAIALLAAKGFLTIPNRWLRTAFLLTFVLLAVLGLPRYYRHRAEFQEWRAATEYVVANAHTNDAAVFCVAPGRLLFEFYERQYRTTGQPPIDIAYPEFRSRSDPHILEYLPVAKGSLFDDVASKHDRVWLVISNDHFLLTREVSTGMTTAFAARYPHVEEKKINDVRVILYSK